MKGTVPNRGLSIDSSPRLASHNSVRAIVVGATSRLGMVEEGNGSDTVKYRLTLLFAAPSSSRQSSSRQRSGSPAGGEKKPKVRGGVS